jgi:hypothetical protein
VLRMLPGRGRTIDTHEVGTRLLSIRESEPQDPRILGPSFDRRKQWRDMGRARANG